MSNFAQRMFSAFCWQDPYDGSNLVRVTDANKKTIWAITWNNGKVVNLTNAAGESFEYVTNHRGDVVRILDQNGATVATYDYDPWGNLLAAEPADSRIKGQPIRYAGYVYDAETKLYYLQARYYDPATARFISRDPDPGDEDDPVTMNGYTYADDNPITKTDPDGKWVWLVINAGFAIYDGYKAYKAGKNKKQIAWAVASNFFPLGKVKRIYRATKITKGVGKTVKAGCNCFVAGTKVLTDEGEKNIEDIEVGDMVLAKDENDPDGQTAYKEVTNLFRNQRDDIIKLHVGEQVIETTDNHPFWVEGKGWVFADELQIGDKLQKADGSNLTIDKVEFVKLDEPVTVYNFTVEDYHTYYVTDIGIWVHNTQCNLSKWNKGSFNNIQGSAEYHFKKHGKEVGANDLAQYIRKAEEFARTAKKGSTKSYVNGAVNGTIRYKKSGKYIDIAPNGTIVSFGKS